MFLDPYFWREREFLQCNSGTHLNPPEDVFMWSWEGLLQRWACLWQSLHPLPWQDSNPSPAFHSTSFPLSYQANNGVCNEFAICCELAVVTSNLPCAFGLLPIRNACFFHNGTNSLCAVKNVLTTACVESLSWWVGVRVAATLPWMLLECFASLAHFFCSSHVLCFAIGSI